MLNEFDILFTGGRAPLDRAAHLRRDAEALARREDARTALFWRGQMLMAGDPCATKWLSLDRDLLGLSAEPPIFLGLQDGVPRFALHAALLDEREVETRFHGAFFVNPRASLTELGHGDAGVVSAGKGLIEWHRTHGFCARCGGPSTPSDGGWRRDCAGCGATHFPRTDPVVIMLITRGEMCLLGRSGNFLPDMYSLLAGFMEPGETIEAAVRREVLEEADIQVGDVRYLGCQPWPFPTSLMIGCRGEALTEKITLDEDELEDAFWVHRDEVRKALAGEANWRAARKGAIAWSVLTAWVAGEV